MKIAWFTPFHKASAIGRFSASVTRALSGKAEVDLWISEEESVAIHETDLRVVRYGNLGDVQLFLAKYDFVVYNMGDHPDNHARIYETSRHCPGIVILHDYVLHHFFASYYDRRNGWEEYAHAMERWYGAKLECTERGWAGPLWRVWERDEVVQYPLFEQAVQGSLGVITHSDFVCERVSEVRPGPVEKLHLAYTVDRTSPVLSRFALDIPQDRLLVVTVGNVNANKRIDVVLRALARDRDMAARLTYVVVGDCAGPFGESVQALRKELKLEDTVRFTGRVDDQTLRSYLSNADFCINLRWPVMEGGSASCAEQMLFEKAGIVTDAGVYGELPGDCVMKVRPDHEAEDLVCHIRELASNSRLRLDIGRRAVQYAIAHFDPALYAARILDFCDSLAAYRPAFSLMELAGKELSRLGVTPDMAIVDTVAREGAMLLDGDYDSPILRENSLWSPQ